VKTLIFAFLCTEMQTSKYILRYSREDRDPIRIREISPKNHLVSRAFPLGFIY